MNSVWLLNYSTWNKSGEILCHLCPVDSTIDSLSTIFFWASDPLRKGHLGNHFPPVLALGMADIIYSLWFGRLGAEKQKVGCGDFRFCWGLAYW